MRDANYPKKLLKIKNPPKQLYVEGNIELLNSNIIAIIGSRNCTEKGKEYAKRFASELAEQGIVVASGMAIGIDTSAHEGTMQVNGKTIAVLGSGLNNIFPKENIKLYKKILECGGTIISEYPPETKPKSELFLERNRIISGLSIGILVIEARYRSGTSVTAKIAEEQGKKIFVLPHEIDNKCGIGTNRLIRNGGVLVTCTIDIIKEIKFLNYKKIEKKSIPTISVQMKKEYSEVYELIKNGVMQIEEISKKSNKQISDISNILFMLEIEGYIKKVAGGYICV